MSNEVVERAANLQSTDLSIVETMFIVDVQIETALTEKVIITRGAFVTFAGDRTCPAPMARIAQVDRGFLSLLSTTVTENDAGSTVFISFIGRHALPKFLFQLLGCAKGFSAERAFDGFLSSGNLMIKPYLHAFHMYVVSTTTSRESIEFDNGVSVLRERKAQQTGKTWSVASWPETLLDRWDKHRSQRLDVVPLHHPRLHHCRRYPSRETKTNPWTSMAVQLVLHLLCFSDDGAIYCVRPPPGPVHVTVRWFLVRRVLVAKALKTGQASS